MRCIAYLYVVLFVLLSEFHETRTKQQASVISSSSVRIPWVWPQIQVTTWIPPSSNSSESLLEIRVDFGEGVSDSLWLQRDRVALVTSEEDDVINEPVFLHTKGKDGEGWLNVTFEIKENYALKSTSDDLDFKAEVPKSASVKEVTVYGSNITVNCDSSKLIWRVFTSRTVVPLTPGGRGWRMEILPSSEVLPSITLDGVQITLGKDEGGQTLTTQSSLPLEPYTYYHFVIECFSSSQYQLETNVTCSIKVKNTVIKTLELPLQPNFLVVEGKSQKPFYLIQDTIPLPYIAIPTTTTPAPDVKQPTSSSGESGSDDDGEGVDREEDSNHNEPKNKNNGKNVKPGWSGWWAALAVILACVLIFVIFMCFVSHYHRPKIEKLDPIWYTRKMSKRYLETMNLISEVTHDQLESTPLPEKRPLIARSCSVVVDVEDPNTTAPLRLWNAVASGDVQEVEQVLATMTPDPQLMLVGWDTSPYEEAHRRGYHDILQVLDSFMGKQPQIPDSDMIINVIQSHTRNVEAVFEAARGGQYRYGGGVDVLLRSHSLPGTVHDRHGQSLLHYAASVKLADGGPLWLAQDIRSLVENHHVFVNAVDYKGKTALHALAEKASMSSQNTCWDGKAVNVDQAWVNLATLIMKLGCDPRLPDNTGLCPDDIARDMENIPLADKLAEERANLGEFDNVKCFSRFKEFLEASKLGRVDRMQELLKEGVCVLPIGSKNDPFQEVIKGGHRDAVFLLLSAGAPLCAHGLVGDTPYEAAHCTKGLPALFPALIRVALCGQIEAEVNIIRGRDDIPEVMKKAFKDIKAIIERSGHKLSSELAKWMESRPSSNFRMFNEMLGTSASLGLTLICQLMGVAGVRVNPLPNEQKPFLCALDNSQSKTMYALCRDLKMNPYCLGLPNDKIPKQIANDLLQSELMAFEKKLHKARLDDVTIKNLMNDAVGLSEMKCPRNPSKLFLYLLAEIGLISLLHQIKKALDDFSINTVVHEATGSTLLHIAAAYGRINMVEYLLYSGIDYTCKTVGGLTASHLAAARGHKKCMQFILDYTKHNEKWNSFLPQQIHNHFEENIKSYYLDGLSTIELDAIANAKDDYTKTQLMISSRCEKRGVYSEKSFRDLLVNEQKLVRDLISDDYIFSLECDVCDFVREIMHIDVRFKGTIVSRTPVFEKTEFFLPESFEFFCELDNYHALEDGCISIGNSIKSGKYGETIDTVKSTKEPEFFTGSNFKQAFYKAAKQALENYKFKSIALIPPFLNSSLMGVNIYGILTKKLRTNLVHVSITPVIKIPCSVDNILHKKYQNQLQFPGYEHLANMEEDKWVYLSNHTFKLVLSALTEEERLVLWTCLYFSKLLSTCWWLPKKHHKRIGCTWQSYPIGVDFPKTNQLIAHFFDELLDLKENQWKKENYMSKVIGVLKRSSPVVKRKVSFLNDMSVTYPFNSTSAVISFLEKIAMKTSHESQDEGQNPPKAYRKFGKFHKAISKSSLDAELE